MSVQVENLEKSMAKLTIEVGADRFETALNKVYQENKAKITLPGFRKGKAPRALIEKMYGSGIFVEDAVNALLPEAYEEAVEESGLDIVSQPSFNLVQAEKNQPVIIEATVAVKPEATLGEYKGIEVEKKTAEVTEEELNEEIDKVRESNSRLITVDDRAVQDGDVTTIDFEGFVDGEPFEGGKGEDYPLTIGSKSFIDNFEEQLIGKNIGEETEVNVTFPEDYSAQELQGKPATFKVTVKEIKVKELPDLDDEFAQDVSEFDTVDEYKDDLRKKLLENKEAAIKREKEEDVITKIIENSTMEIPEPMVDEYVRQMVNEFAGQIQSQGLSLQQYMTYTGMSIDGMREEVRPQALRRIQSRLVLEAVAKAENIEPTAEEVDKEIEDLASLYRLDAEEYKEGMSEKDRKQVEMDVAVQKAVDLVLDAAVEK